MGAASIGTIAIGAILLWRKLESTAWIIALAAWRRLGSPPRFAAASVGESNPFGHPAEAVVERYVAHGVRLLRTDRDGAITLQTDGAQLSRRT